MGKITPTKLTPKEMEVLTMLYKNEGTTVSRFDLVETVWGEPYGNDLGLTQAISKLRRVFNDNPKDPKLIRTIPKKGYQLIHGANESIDPETGNNNGVKKPSGLKKFYKAGIILLFVIALIMLYLLIFGIRIRIRKEVIGLVLH